MLLEEFEREEAAPAPKPWYRRVPSSRAIALAAVGVFALNAVVGVAIVVQLHHANRHASDIGGAIDEFRAPAEHVSAFVSSSRALLSGSVPNLANRVLRKDYAGFGQAVLRFAENFKRAIAPNATNAGAAGDDNLMLANSAEALRADADLPTCSDAFEDKIRSCKNFETESDCNNGPVGCNWCTIHTYVAHYEYNHTCTTTHDGRREHRCVPMETAAFPTCKINYPYHCEDTVFVYENNCRRPEGGKFAPPLPPSGDPGAIEGANVAYASADLAASIASIVAQLGKVDDPGALPRDEDNGPYLDVADYALSLATEQLREDDWIKLASTCVAFADAAREVTWKGSYTGSGGEKNTWDQNDAIHFYLFRIKEWCEAVGRMTPSSEAAVVFANL